MHDDPVYPGWRALACAILERAHKDAHGRNGVRADARQFLAGPGARWLFDCLDLDPGWLDRLCEDLALQEEPPAPLEGAAVVDVDPAPTGGKEQPAAAVGQAPAPMPERKPRPAPTRAPEQAAPLEGTAPIVDVDRLQRRRVRLALELAAGKLTGPEYRRRDDALLAAAGLAYDPDRGLCPAGNEVDCERR